MIESGVMYTCHPSNVHEFVFQDVQRPTLSTFAEHLKTIIKETPEGNIMRLVVAIPAIPSIQYMLGIIREVRVVHPKVPRARIALVYNPMLQLSLLNMVIKAVVRTSTVKLFLQKDEQTAHDWIVRDQ